LQFKNDFAFALGCPTVCVTRKWAGWENAWEQKKLEARKLLENRAESHLSGARFVRRFCAYQNAGYKKTAQLKMRNLRQ
jgi:hypothetical protein